MSAFVDALSTAIQRRPALLQLATGLARRISPVWVVGRSVIALDSDAVREVFERANHFELGPVGHRKMLLGRFLLGMDPRGDYSKEREALGELLKKLLDDLVPIARGAAETTRDLLAATIGPTGATIDIVSEFAEPIVMEIVAKFFGVPFPDPKRRSKFVKGGGRDLLAAWVRKVGSVIASTSPAPFGLQRVADDCKGELGDYLDEVIAARIAARDRGEPREATVLDRLLDLENEKDDKKLDRSRIRPNLAGLILAGSAPIIKSYVCAVRQLYATRPPKKESQWLPAIDAARCAAQTDAATARQGAQDLRALLFEAMRFAPTFPMLVRYCPRDTTLGEGERERKIPAGSTVYAVPFAAMFDDIVEDADAFSARRPAEHYLHFGSGQHECLGRDVATTVLTEMLRAFLTLPGIDRDRAKPGRIRYDGSAVDRCRIRIPGAAS